jgi:hypothetical protein
MPVCCLEIVSFHNCDICYREEARLNDLRERYESFLEEEKQRRERNGRILQALDRIESRTAILTAKSERLRLLRVSYL